MSDLDIYSKDPLRSWGYFSCLISQIFLEEAPKWSANVLVAPAWAGLSPIRHTRGSPLLYLGPDILGHISSAIFIGYSNFRLLIWRRFSQALDPKVLPDSQVFPKFSEGLLHDCEQRPEKFASCLMLLSYRDREVIVGILPFSPTGFIVWPLERREEFWQYLLYLDTITT